jgi:hypothetical protein
MSRRRKGSAEPARPGNEAEGLVARARRELARHKPDVEPVLADSPDGIKMSEVLLRFIEPYVSDEETIEEYRSLVAAAVIAWNIALLPWGRHAEALETVVAETPADARPALKRSFREMIQRKRREFGDCKRMVFNFDVQSRGDGFYLAVVTSPGEAPGDEQSAADEPDQGLAPNRGESSSE